MDFYSGTAAVVSYILSIWQSSIAFNYSVAEVWSHRLFNSISPSYISLRKNLYVQLK